MVECPGSHDLPTSLLEDSVDVKDGVLGHEAVAGKLKMALFVAGEIAIGRIWEMIAWRMLDQVRASPNSDIFSYNESPYVKCLGGGETLLLFFFS